jgi:arginine decarboxylase
MENAANFVMEACMAAARREASSGSQRTQTIFYSAFAERLDRWRTLNRIVRSWDAAEHASHDEKSISDLRSIASDLLGQMDTLESFFAYPGPKHMATVRERLAEGDSGGLVRLVQRISAALLSRSYREDPTAAEFVEESDSAPQSASSPPQNGAGAHKPYFEALFVSSTSPGTWGDIRNNIRRLRRPQDEFIYEPVMVGSFEDAVVAAVINPSIEAIVIYDGFPYESHHSMPLLRDYLTGFIGQRDPMQTDYGCMLARIIKGFRPELDIYLLTDRNVEQLAGSDESAPIRRIFYQVEERLEIHLSILDGIADRYDTPYFDNLQKYAQRPIGTFHALPIARGKAIFKSNWIRDMGQFYGPNLFLAESSATTGGLDSLLEPTGNIKVAQDKAARAFGADRAFFVTNGTSTSNKIVEQALLKPGDIVLVDRNCHKSHHYGMVLAGAQPYYLEAYPMMEYSMYGGVPLRAIKQALLTLKAEGKLDATKMVLLTNCTFDGHVYHARRVMEECLAIKPDLIFLWDEAWFGFAHFSPYLRRRTAMGAAKALHAQFRDAGYRKRYEDFRKQAGDLDPGNAALLDMRLLPDPDKARLRVYQTNSTHKSMSALRQGSMILVFDQDWHTIEEQFHEAFFTHTSTSPNLQIIASLDVARRQMELEGYELVMGAIQLSIELRREINAHSLISKYFRILTPEEMIPAELRATKFKDYGPPHSNWCDAVKALDEDEFFLDPTRMTLVCGTAGFDGTQFKGLLAEKYDIQINKTSRNSILVQININNTRSDAAHLIKVLADISRAIEKRLGEGGTEEQEAFAARVRSLTKDVPDLPNFSRFADIYRDKADSKTLEGRIREAYYAAYDAAGSEHVKLNSKEIDRRLREGPELVSANFVIPYPPGFPIMVPGQVISQETIDFMRKLDVKEIHGYTASLGLKVLKSAAAATAPAKGRGKRQAEPVA